MQKQVWPFIPAGLQDLSKRGRCYPCKKLLLKDREQEKRDRTAFTEPFEKQIGLNYVSGARTIHRIVS